MFGDEVPNLVAYFHPCGYLLRYVELFAFCLVQELSIDCQLHVFAMFNYVWSHVFSAGGDDEVFVFPERL